MPASWGNKVVVGVWMDQKERYLIRQIAHKAKRSVSSLLRDAIVTLLKKAGYRRRKPRNRESRV